ncbi:MAG: DNA-directed RNA polymerase subunit beta, partial [Mycoplasmataceae bacterium]|nr:DNA-directed RNA polymerase subunit beta [Mycoplasmataceae bacterium]
PFDEKTGEIKVKTYACRYLGDYAEKEKNEIEYIEISPRQVISVSTNLVPFIESDEGHRGEMAANMQRQAIPLIKPHAPMVGTGFEHKIAKDSALGIIAEEDGVIDYADSERISVDGKKYKLLKFNKSNQNTCFNQKPLVGVGSKVKAGEMIADGPAMDNGEIALGQNIHVAFVPWNGYTFEDAIAISDRIAKNDILTSITIEEIICEVIKTQNGDEEVTRNIVNVSEEAKKMLDDDGIITIGAYVKEGDIIVGKNSPKGKSEKPTDEEKFFYQYFGNKISEYKDKSMHVKYGSEGVVCYVKRIPSNKNDNISNNVIETIKVYVAQKRKLQVGDKLAGRHGNKGVVSIVVPEHDMPHYADGTPIDICLNPAGVPSRMNLGQIMETHFGLALRQQIVNKLFKYTVDNDATAISQQFGLDASIAKKIIKVASQYVHDTKTIGKEFKYIDVAIILKQVGLEFEDLNLKVSSPGFFGANIKTIEDEMKEAGINVKENGKTILYDGKTGNAFDNPITTGIIYMMKLDHMIEDKIHARSVGPYSKITQQPLGGKSQNGGQRVGEMEVWAFEAYGAAYNLRELLTIKSDDVYGRNKMYKNIIYNQDIVQPSIPDAFLYMTKLLQGLCLQINVFDDENIIYDINDYVRKETKVVKSETFQQVSTNESSYGEGEIEE